MNSKEIEKVISFCSVVQEKVGQILVDFFAKYCEDGISKLSAQEQIRVTQEVVVQLSILLASFVISNEPIEDGLVDLASDFILEQEINPPVQLLCNFIKNYRSWLKGDSCDLASRAELDTQMSKHHAFGLIWLIENYFDLMENNFIFKCIQSSRSYLEKQASSSVVDWGLGLLCYFQARVFSKVANPILLGSQFLEKGINYLTSVNGRDNNEEFYFMYVQNPKYILSCAYGLNKDDYLCFNWFLKAKLNKELPPIATISLNKSLNYITSLFDFETICIECDSFAQERQSFLTEQHEFGHNKNCMPIVEVNLDDGNTLSESTLMKDLFTKSTMELLKRDPSFDIKAFFSPVKPIGNDEAKTRLKERMDYCNLEPRRDIPGDGNCQFYSLSDQLTNSISHAPFIRRSLVNWLRLNSDTVLENGAKVKEFIYDRGWDDYLKDMSQDKSWGDHLTLIAAAEIFQKSIIVVSSIPNEHYLLEIHPTISNAFSTGKIYLSHLTEFHYGSVQEKFLSDQSSLNFKVFTIENKNAVSPLMS